MTEMLKNPFRYIFFSLLINAVECIRLMQLSKGNIKVIKVTHAWNMLQSCYNPARAGWERKKKHSAAVGFSLTKSQN